VSRDGAVVSTVGAGQFIGEMAVLSDSRRNATVVARSELEVLVLTRRGLDQLLDDVPGFAKALLREVVARVARPESVAGVL
jgi:CRP/FNR family cyclic AMP-dependent transcriptional regulator